MALCVGVAVAAMSCDRDDKPDAAGARTAPTAGAAGGVAVSSSSRAQPMPQMQLARVMANDASGGTVVQVRVLFAGFTPTDTIIGPQRLAASCGATFRDTLVAHRGDAVAGVLLWMEGDVPVVPAAAPPVERRPTVRLERCRLQPRMQLAVPGSTVQLLMEDKRTDTLIVVPAAGGGHSDTVSFITDGQLVPLRRSDRPGVIGIHAVTMPWARAYVAIAPAGTAAISDADGRASFTLSRQGRAATIRAWHPVLGSSSATLTPLTLQGGGVVTLTFRR